MKTQNPRLLIAGLMLYGMGGGVLSLLWSGLEPSLYLGIGTMVLGLIIALFAQRVNIVEQKKVMVVIVLMEMAFFPLWFPLIIFYAGGKIYQLPDFTIYVLLNVLWLFYWIIFANWNMNKEKKTITGDKE